MAPKYLKLSNILRKLLFDNNMKPADLAREINLPPPTIHRLITGKSTRPYLSSLQPIADYFSVSVNELLGEESLPTNNTDNQKSPTKQIIRKIPLIAWQNLHLIKSTDLATSENIPYIGNIGSDSFATTMQDSSMEPVFSPGTLLIFDPLKTPQDRSYVLALLGESNLPVFRQLLIDLEHKYIKPLNPDLNSFKIRHINNKDKILGTLVESRKIYSEA